MNLNEHWTENLLHLIENTSAILLAQNPSLILLAQNPSLNLSKFATERFVRLLYR